MIRARPLAKTLLCPLFRPLFRPLFFAILLGSATSFARGPSVPDAKIIVLDPSRPDFTLQAISSDKAQSRILDELRKSYVAAMGSDPLSRRFDRPIEIKAKIRTKMGAAIKRMVEDILNVRLDPSEIVITLEGLRIESPEATLRFDGATVRDGGIDFVAKARLKRTVARVDRIVLRFRSNQETRSFLDTFFLELKGTSLRAERLDSLAADVRVRTETLPNGAIRLGLDSGALKIFDDVEAEELAEELVFDPGEIRLPDGFGIQVGAAVLPYRPEGLKEIVHRRRAQIARLMIDPLAKELREAPTKLFRNGAPSFTLPSVLEAELPCLGRLGIRLMRYGVMGGNQLHLAFGLAHPEYGRSDHGVEYYERATESVFAAVNADRASVVAGLGYRALEWALERGVDRCLKSKFPKDVSLGAQGVSVRLDERGHGLGVYAAHAQLRLKWYLRWLLGQRRIELPLKLSPKLDYLPRTADSDPKLRLDLSDADLSNGVLIDGYKDIPSNVDRTTVHKIAPKVIPNVVRKKLRPLLEKAKLDIPIPFAKGEDLTFAEVESDGFGSLNLNLRLDPELDSGARGFWSLFAEYLEPVLEKAARRRAQGAVERRVPAPNP